MPLTMNNAEAIELYECHEGNRGVSSILSGARRDGTGATDWRTRCLKSCDTAVAVFAGTVLPHGTFVRTTTFRSARGAR